MMALINCPECDASVSDQAIKCPSCGARLRKPARSFFGKLVKYLFFAWNLFMATWLVVGTSSAAKNINGAQTGAEQAGAAIGTGIGMMMILVVWTFGAIIIGLFVLVTRPKD